MEINTRATLLDCLHRDESRLDPAALSVLTDEGWTALIEMATRHGVAPLLYQRLKASPLAGCVPDDVRERLRGLYLNTAACNVRLYKELRPLLLALHEVGIPVLVLKGAYLAENVYRNIALRPMGDIDILVPKTAARDVFKVLKKNDYKLLNPATEEVIPFFGKDMVLIKEGYDFLVEVHWTLTNNETTVNMDELWRHSQSIFIDGVETGILSLEDFLLHICLHASYHHEFNVSLMALYDIAFFVDRFQQEFDWNVFFLSTSNNELRKGVYLVLHLSRDLVGANVPPETLESLKPVNLPEAMIMAAEYRLFHGQDSAANFSKNLISLWSSEGLIDKFRIVWRRFFPCREEMAYMYPVLPYSPWLYGYYLVRIKDLVIRHSVSLWRLLRGDRELTETVRQRDALREWLFKPDAQ